MMKAVIAAPGERAANHQHLEGYGNCGNGPLSDEDREQ